MKISVIGLGAMGEPIARNLLKAGFPLTVYNRTSARCEPFRGAAAIAPSAREAFLAADAALLLLPGDREIDQVLGRDGGRITAEISGRIVVNMATVAPEYSERLAGAVTAAGGRYVEAPVSGSRKPAEAGALVVLAAGDGADTDRLAPLFDAIGKKTVLCGAPPNAMRMKLANNLLLTAMLEAFAEACHFAAAGGLDPERFLDLVLEGQMANDIFRAKAPKLLARDFAPQAGLKHVVKDIDLICREAERLGVNTPAAKVSHSLFTRAVECGLGEEDVIGVVRVLEAEAYGKRRPLSSAPEQIPSDR
ncbi:NAD(P)-dependent oxidoreductase [Geobacter sp. FeAm09]|uniref:NAD(P)-dependent oxidoreductase n=1 Tax=Geobacter sp. FeAm09 TaxID=2597769 RepID=UPI0011EE4A15|nr:NAD(P)-dependent oxidoreductase [Geobacter sp. FeAm09]QEM67478.1 NAD(P)-dependent oxidoreductase [Geobacter sp. FeAm09]